MPGGVPMSWMVKWPGDFPVFVEPAAGAHFTCVDGIDHVDLCLGDTGAMMGHSPAADDRGRDHASSRAGSRRCCRPRTRSPCRRGLAERFGLPYWQFTLTATDANRHAIRYARHLTGRSKVVVHDWCYHGSVDEAFATLGPDGRTVRPPRQHRRPGRPRRRPRGSSSSTTSTRSSGPSPTATSPRSSSSRP